MGNEKGLNKKHKKLAVSNPKPPPLRLASFVKFCYIVTQTRHSHVFHVFPCHADAPLLQAMSALLDCRRDAPQRARGRRLQEKELASPRPAPRGALLAAASALAGCGCWLVILRSLRRPAQVPAASARDPFAWISRAAAAGPPVRCPPALRLGRA